MTIHDSVVELQLCGFLLAYCYLPIVVVIILLLPDERRDFISDIRRLRRRITGGQSH
jgi:hypothetical protein